MLAVAERVECRHRALVGYLGESITPCGTSCDVCSGRDIVAEAPLVSGKKPRRRTSARAVVEARASAAPPEPRPRAIAGDLFGRLRELRKSIADARNVPAYVVFSDATLLEMARRKPRTEGELLDVSGVGPKKLASYGKAFLDLLRSE
jgi:ATP-dependent DNA helicase RecQ